MLPSGSFHPNHNQFYLISNIKKSFTGLDGIGKLNSPNRQNRLVKLQDPLTCAINRLRGQAAAQSQIMVRQLMAPDSHPKTVMIVWSPARQSSLQEKVKCEYERSRNAVGRGQRTEPREVGEGERLESPPTPLRFLREFVSPNKPCLISNATLHWPALSSWSHDDYLSRALSNDVVSLHLTPNGRADALVPAPSTSSSSLCFASPYVHRLLFPEALRLILSCGNANSSGTVAYAQQQNDCFRSEYSALAADCEPHIPWASQALGCLPEAVNLWIGNHLSETSFHKDHYENLYAVVCGQKHFLLLPPTDVHRMYIRQYPAAHYSFSQDSGQLKLELDNPARNVPWCSVNPYPSPETKDAEISQFPLYFNGPKPLECTVKAGEILYL
ncbi:JmjC domain-containing protein 7 [Vitis vinifera]|uniref:JmjC domain-containing protein 7 n=1 Tax=Vitis vinifera TaxID=29760 RepID=A0A438G6A1_VITVI|nr:JmjC domain-containing protein 7 [Vitis vinifera]